MRCLVKSFNERNPPEMLVNPFVNSCTALALHQSTYKEKTTLFILPVIYWRKVRITSSRHDPYELGYTRVTLAVTMGCNGESRSESLKAVLVQIALCKSRA